MGREGQRTGAYEEVLRKAANSSPFSVFVDPLGVKKGLYRLDGGAVRTLPIADVERKRRELTNQTNGEAEKF